MISISGAGLIIFARVPELGKVKTRLGERYTREQTLQIYEAMVRDTLDTARSARPQICNISLYWGGPSESQLPECFKKESAEFRYCTQSGRDLGEKMYNAMREEFQRNSERVLVIGSDTPHLNARFLADAADLLQNSEVVLGPAEDGGYYLIGTKRLTDIPFQGVPWGTQEVLSRTVEMLQEADLELVLLPELYDIDRPEDLDRLEKDSSAGAPHTREVIRRIRCGVL